MEAREKAVKREALFNREAGDEGGSDKRGVTFSTLETRVVPQRS